VVSTIHHQNLAIEAYYNNAEFNSGSSLFKKFGIDFSASNIIRERVNLFRDLQPRESLSNLGLTLFDMQKYVIDNSVMVYPMAMGEKESITEDISDITNKHRVIYNPFTFNFQKGNSSNQLSSFGRKGILCVGRIEPRKNQLGLMESLKNENVEVCFIGMPNKNHKQYLEKFFKNIEKFPKFKYHPHMKQEDLLDYYRSAKLHVSLSWFEVVSQVDLEAISQGCKIVSTKYGHIREYLNSKNYEYDPLKEYNNNESIRNTVINAYEDNENIDIKKEMVHAWDYCIKSLDEDYINILGI
jgi:glycosyltransferase involved in cell wall biosynthesis